RRREAVDVARVIARERVEGGVAARVEPAGVERERKRRAHARHIELPPAVGLRLREAERVAEAGIVAVDDVAARVRPETAAAVEIGATLEDVRAAPAREGDRRPAREEKRADEKRSHHRAR